mgnify:CR=1 FL=1
MLIFLYLFFFNKINNLNKKAKEYFNLSSKFSFIIALRMGVFLNKCLFAYITLKFLRINKVILVNRVVFLPFIAVAKKNNIKVLELQHGITHSETDLYMGEYQYEIDPDYFLNFGSIWVGNQFSISKEKQVVIGWAYKDWLLSRINVGLIPKSVLVVSSPSITSRILKSTIELATEFKNYNFILRLHPQEKLDSTQIKELENYINIIIDDNIQDSLFSILKCQFIIGENSSVLYEAISLAKPVAKIMFNGLKSKNILDNNIETIQYLFEVADFSCFISNSLVKSKYLNGYCANVQYSYHIHKHINKVINTEPYKTPTTLASAMQSFFQAVYLTLLFRGRIR